jgi:hypothetical protein
VYGRLTQDTHADRKCQLLLDLIEEAKGEVAGERQPRQRTSIPKPPYAETRS